MEYYKIILSIHVIFGFGALIGGLFPMFSKKGSRLHSITGWVYFWSMFGVFVTTTIMFFLKQTNGLLFLMLIGVLSFFMTFSGVRAVKLKKKGSTAALIDWLVAGFVLVCGFFMLGLSAYHWINDNGTFFIVLFAVFGSLTIAQARENLLDFNSRRLGTIRPKHWMYYHATKMGGAYIATFTAFVVTNVHFLPPLVVWITPGILGGIVLSRVVSKRFSKDKKSLRSQRKVSSPSKA